MSLITLIRNAKDTDYVCVVMHMGGVTITVEWLLHSLSPGLIHCFRNFSVGF